MLPMHQYFFLSFGTLRFEKFRIQETLTLSTCADSSTDTKKHRNGQKGPFFPYFFFEAPKKLFKTTSLKKKWGGAGPDILTRSKRLSCRQS